MLGRLQMSVEACIDTCARIESEVFENPRSLSRLDGRPVYDAAKLEDLMQSVVREYSPRKGAKNRDPLSELPNIASKT